MTTTMKPDDDIRELFAALREAEPAPGAADRAVHALEALRPAVPRRVTVPRVAVGVVAATAVGLGVIAALPGVDNPTAGGLSALHSAAAAAAEQPAPATGYRYVSTLERWTYRSAKDPSASVSFTVPSEAWIDRSWKGRILTGKSVDIARTGDPQATAHEPTQLLPPGEHPYQYGDGMLANLSSETLPTTGADVDAYLKRLYHQANWAPGHPTADQEVYDLLRAKLLLLTQANTTAPQRAALYDALALTPGLTDRGDGHDPLGRPGHVVEVPVVLGGPARITVVFDPETSEVLSWTESTRDGTAGAYTPGQQHVFVMSGHVATEGTRP
jgi:hypothetical protein